MVDYAKCLNVSCPLKFDCYRYMAPASTYQSYSSFKPDEDGKCEYFIQLSNLEKRRYNGNQALRLQK